MDKQKCQVNMLFKKAVSLLPQCTEKPQFTSDSEECQQQCSQTFCWKLCFWKPSTVQVYLVCEFQRVTDFRWHNYMPQFIMWLAGFNTSGNSAFRSLKGIIFANLQWEDTKRRQCLMIPSFSNDNSCKDMRLWSKMDCVNKKTTANTSTLKVCRHGIVILRWNGSLRQKAKAHPHTEHK